MLLRVCSFVDHKLQQASVSLFSLILFSLNKVDVYNKHRKKLRTNEN